MVNKTENLALNVAFSFFQVYFSSAPACADHAEQGTMQRYVQHCHTHVWRKKGKEVVEMVFRYIRTSLSFLLQFNLRLYPGGLITAYRMPCETTRIRF